MALSPLSAMERTEGFEQESGPRATGNSPYYAHPHNYLNTNSPLRPHREQQIISLPINLQNNFSYLDAIVNLIYVINPLIKHITPQTKRLILADKVLDKFWTAEYNQLFTRMIEKWPLFTFKQSHMILDQGPALGLIIKVNDPEKLASFWERIMRLTAAQTNDLTTAQEYEVTSTLINAELILDDIVQLIEVMSPLIEHLNCNTKRLFIGDKILNKFWTAEYREIFESVNERWSLFKIKEISLIRETGPIASFIIKINNSEELLRFWERIRGIFHPKNSPMLQEEATPPSSLKRKRIDDTGVNINREEATGQKEYQDNVNNHKSPSPYQGSQQEEDTDVEDGNETSSLIDLGNSSDKNNLRPFPLSAILNNTDSTSNIKDHTNAKRIRQGANSNIDWEPRQDWDVRLPPMINSPSTEITPSSYLTRINTRQKKDLRPLDNRQLKRLGLGFTKGDLYLFILAKALLNKNKEPHKLEGIENSLIFQQQELVDTAREWLRIKCETLVFKNYFATKKLNSDELKGEPYVIVIRGRGTGAYQICEGGITNIKNDIKELQNKLKLVESSNKLLLKPGDFYLENVLEPYETMIRKELMQISELFLTTFT